MDDIDRSLLSLLEENCSTPLHELAVMLGCSDEDVEKRRQQLEKDGIIRRYSAVINWEQVDKGAVYAIIELKVAPERDYGYDRIAARISRFSNVRNLRLRTGTHDLQLLVKGKSMQEIARFVSEQIAPMERIRETATHIIMKTYKENGVLYVEREDGQRLPFSF
ncbi:Lrp/AsnC family transcriptional regulator [Methanospirillum sp. J.3.6.1-F.2.7.3]|jgi:DNA-binding Lrp family transcriptional regulator|uniref:Lrp/AsnC family transcriptional regulator n=2 Tax=Methanospirillum TaxID=2202 RepID=A0A8E7EJZ4_9EURY|nr:MULTISPECIES: Lrp/AsnC family transcriptional regulator [Methanospirillum]MDX8549581.1 Lrp/AsnC family transcriptional regulator [Methanospirillum hungatei]NLW75786.1 Lrp/AsnC family transcriptional regulator [Methanomicrobiales archaeon]QVV88965.1 Lrp/AsnC family transcriptional regulator [Methanospirillum sp. J.3.6.1-F.2.7.3]QXO93702.1 Lrp/AsnC family transcriptional regulator [Methanospirillum hungatei]